MNKLEKKQIPQFAALCVLSTGLFGYFVVKMVTPSPAAAAGTRPHPLAEAAAKLPASSSPAAKAEAGAETASASTEAEAPAPTPGMRDPFIVGYVDPKTSAAPGAAALPAAPIRPAAAFAKPAKAAPLTASVREISPVVPALPFGLKGFPPLDAGGARPSEPVLPASAARPAVQAALPAPKWSVTGVLQNNAAQVAILRSGEARCIVRTGDYVDSLYRVVSVTRSAVVLRHGKTFYHLTLGGDKPAAAPASPAARTISSPARPLPSAPQTAKEAAVVSTGRPAGLDAGLAQVIQAAVMLARSYLTPAQAEVEVCLAAFHARRALPPRVALRFLDGSVPGSNEALAHLKRGRDLYRSGQRTEGRAQWRQVLAMDDFEAADEAGKLLNRYN